MAGKINARMLAVGGIFDISGPKPRCIGSCSAVGSATTFVTAAHVVAGREREQLAVNHFGHRKYQFSLIKEIIVKKELDAALLDVVVEIPAYIKPFTRAQFQAWYGSEVAAIGWPVDLLSPEAGKETLRCFRGNIQRTFLYTPPSGKSYRAFELSFAVPPGMSGAPVFLADKPEILIGIVTENFKSYSLIDETIETTDAKGNIQRTEARGVINYGVATIAGDICDIFKTRLSGVSVEALGPMDDTS